MVAHPFNGRNSKDELDSSDVTHVRKKYFVNVAVMLSDLHGFKMGESGNPFRMH